MGPRLTYEGYLRIDHTASPGLPPEVAIRAGYLPESVAEGALFETKTLNCARCRTSIVPNPLRTRDRYYPAAYNFRYVCDPCASVMQHPDYVHVSFEKFVDQTFEAGTPRGLTCI